MTGVIMTYQNCPKCGTPFPSSKGNFPIICSNDCKTQPTKYHIQIWWHKPEKLYHDRSGRTFHDWGHVSATFGEIRSRMADHKAGKGFFDPAIYKKQSSTSFKAFWERFLKKYSGATHDKIDAINRHHLSYFNDYQMRDIQSWHIDDWWTELKAKGLSDAYMNDILVWTKSFFNNAKAMKVIEEILVFPKSLSIPEPDVDKWLTQEEQDTVFLYIPDYDRPIFNFLFLTGCRVGEAIALQRSDIGWQHERIIIQSTIKRDNSIGQTKNKKKRRIPLKPEIKETIKKAIKISGLANDFVFVNKWGRRYSDDYLRDTFRQACIEAEIEPIQLKNATRHSAGMRLIGAGYSMESVRNFFNHSSTQMTRHYAKVMDSEIDKMYERSKEKENLPETYINIKTG